MMMNQHDYLWDRSGPPDPEIERLEQTLSAFRMREQPLDLTRATPSRSLSLRAWRIGFAFAACSVVLLVVLAWVALHRARAGWQFVATSGVTQVDGKSMRAGRLRVGQSLENPPNTVLRLRVGDIGDVELFGAARVELAESRERRQRLVLRYGTMHARISADPGVFVVDAPAARAIDLGCEYTLTADERGDGQLRVDFGWVQLQYGWRKSLVPQGAEARFAPVGRITPPYFPDATPAFRSALIRYSLEDNLGEAERARLVSEMVRDARLRDSLTLLNLFGPANSAERALLFDRLNALVPAPAEVDRSRVIAGELGASSAWWAPIHRALGIAQIKKKGPLNLDTYRGQE